LFQQSDHEKNKGDYGAETTSSFKNATHKLNPV
jgi:hypothetical protein